MSGPAAVLTIRPHRSDPSVALRSKGTRTTPAWSDQTSLTCGRRVVADLDRTELNARDAKPRRDARDGVPELVNERGDDQREQADAERHRQRRQ